MVISDPTPSSDTFKRKRQKTKNTWLIFGVKSNSLTLTLVMNTRAVFLALHIFKDREI